MAKGKSSFENMGEGLFGVPQRKEETNIMEIAHNPKTEQEQEKSPIISSNLSKKSAIKRKAGKPKDDDLQELEETIPTIVQLTKSTKYAIDKYTLEKGYTSRSQAIRELIRGL